MRISLKEPSASRYLYINPNNNNVHLLVPMLADRYINSGNSLQTENLAKEFFERNALLELQAYKEALEFDLALLETSHPIHKNKRQRLEQIEKYLEAAQLMQKNYGPALTSLLKRPSNLYGIQLRTAVPDPHSRVENPVFTVKQGNDANAAPLSALYRNLHAALSAPEQSQELKVLAELYLKILSDHCRQKKLSQRDFVEILTDNPALRQDFENTIAEALSAEDFNAEEMSTIVCQFCNLYADEFGLLAALRPEDQAEIQQSFSIIETVELYDTVANRSSMAEQEAFASEQSILIQFYLGVLNVYCRAQAISKSNFGEILDSNSNLSKDFAETIIEGLQAEEDLSSLICDFFTVNAAEFGLQRSLDQQDRERVQKNFERYQKQLHKFSNNPRMDDFMLLGYGPNNETALFLETQHFIAVDFANIVDNFCPNLDYFSKIRQDSVQNHLNRQAQNASEIEVSIAILAKLNPSQWQQLPEWVRETCNQDPNFQQIQFLKAFTANDIEQVNTFLQTNQALQEALQIPVQFTDSAGRTFECTAYEYAYWANNPTMAELLASYMNDETKQHCYKKIAEIATAGLNYQQNGADHCSKQFDLSSLKQALEQYAAHYEQWHDDENWSAIARSWSGIEKARQGLPENLDKDLFTKVGWGETPSQRPTQESDKTADVRATSGFGPAIARILLLQIKNLEKNGKQEILQALEANEKTRLSR